MRAAVHLISQYLCVLDWSCLYVYEMHRYVKLWIVFLLCPHFLLLFLMMVTKGLVDIHVILMMSHTHIMLSTEVCVSFCVVLMEFCSRTIFLNDLMISVGLSLRSTVPSIFTLLFLFNCNVNSVLLPLDNILINAFCFTLAVFATIYYLLFLSGF